MLPLFETIKIEGGLWKNLYWHHQRMHDARKAIWGVHKTLAIPDWVSIPDNYRQGIVRCRLPYGKRLGKPEFSKYSVSTIKSLQIVKSQPFEYSFKYSDRSKLDFLFQMRNECDEILIVIDEYLTDASIGNIVVNQDGRWYTPENPLLRGTQREKLIDNGDIIPRLIKAETLSDYTYIAVINAMREFDQSEKIPTSAVVTWKGEVINFP